MSLHAIARRIARRFVWSVVELGNGLIDAFLRRGTNLQLAVDQPRDCLDRYAGNLATSKTVALCTIALAITAEP
jgi:hypothetical protein